MKKILMLSLVALGLSGCVAVPGLLLYTDSVTISSDYIADLPDDGSSQKVSVICDDRVTTVTYTFDYDGDLASWRSELVGSLGSVTNSQNYTIVGTPPQNGRVRAEYRITPEGAPLSKPGGISAQSLSAQGIVVVPNVRVIGSTKVRFSATNSSGDRTSNLESAALPVVDNCSDAIPL